MKVASMPFLPVGGEDDGGNAGRDEKVSPG